MVNARDHLNQSLSELQIADPFDSGGHREQAVEMVRLAIDEVNQGIDYAALHQKHPVAFCFSRWAAHPHRPVTSRLARVSLRFAVAVRPVTRAPTGGW